MDKVKAIAESDKISDEHKPQLTQQVLAAGAAATSQPVWDNWAQRLVAGGLGLIGFSLAVFVGIAVIQQDHIDSAVTSALTAVICGMAGMFTQKALGGKGGEGNGGGQGAGLGGGDEVPEGDLFAAR